MENSDKEVLRKRREIIGYLTQMAQEMADMARDAAAPSLALLLDMARDEALNFLAMIKKAEYSASLPAETAKAVAAVRKITVRHDSVARGGRSSRSGGNQAAIMAQKTAGKLKIHQPEIKA